MSFLFSQPPGSDSFLGVLIDVTLRGSVLLALVAALAVLLRARSAAVRHVLWTAGILCFLALPALSANLPWKLEVLPGIAAGGPPSVALAPPHRTNGAADSEAAVETAPARVDAARQDLSPTAPTRDGARLGLGGEGRDGAGATAFSARGSEEAALARTGRDATRSGEAGAVPAANPSDRPVPELLAAVGAEGLLLALWALGAGLLALRLAVGSLRVRRLLGRGRELTDEASEREVFHLARRLGIASYVRVVESEEVSMPITSGIARPTIVLPAGFRAWSEDRLRAVILHELAHIHRRDVLSHLVSRVACALHWFNPLAWHSAARLRTESERACDDMVLQAGTRASAYADHLLSILRSCSAVPSPATAIPMARRTEFEGRLLAILEPDLRRAAAGRTTVVLTAAAVALIALPLAALAPGTAAPEGAEERVAEGESARPSSEADARTGSPAVGRAKDPERALVPGAGPDAGDDLTGFDLDLAKLGGGPEIDRDASPDLDFARETDADRDVDGASHRSDGALGDLYARLGDFARFATGAAIEGLLSQEGADQESTDARLAIALGRVLADDAEPDLRRTAAVALGDVDDPRAVEALSRALENDPDASVRRAAAWALGEIESPLAIPALARAASNDDSQEVRAMAVWALGEIEHPDAIPALSEVATSGASPELRRRAVWGLGEIEHPRAVPVLSEIATSNAPMDVRRMAVWGLGAIEHPDAIPALGRLVSDADASLRGMAIWAIGEIEHPDGVQHLATAVRDADPDIRRRAIWALGEIESDRGVDAVAAALDDDDPRMQGLAVWALGQIESDRAVPHLTPLLRDRSAEVRRRAAWALGEIESGNAVEALAALVGDSDLGVRRTVVWALGEIESPGGVPALRRALNDDDRQLRFLALRGLGEIESDAAVEAILVALESDDAEMRRAATAALGRGSGFDYDFIIDFDFGFDFDDLYTDFDWSGWDDAWNEWSDEPDPGPGADFDF